jgi:hypothetical protein
MRVDLVPMGRFDWERLIVGLPLPGSVKRAAYALATFADMRGGGVRPGDELLARACGVKERQVQRAKATLIEQGLIEVVSRGGSRMHYATVYRLTAPTDLLGRVRQDDDGRPYLTSSVTPDTPPQPVDNHRTPVMNGASSDWNSRHPGQELTSSTTELTSSMTGTHVTGDTPPTMNNHRTTTEHPSLNPRDDRYETHRATPRRDDPSDSASQPLAGTPAALAVELAATEAAEAELRAYAEAYQILITLPDLGAFLVERAAREHTDADLAPPSQTRLVIRAAEIWREKADTRRPA